MCLWSQKVLKQNLEIALHSDDRTDDLGTGHGDLHIRSLFVGKLEDFDAFSVFAQIAHIAFAVDFHHQQSIRPDLGDRGNDQNVTGKDPLIFEAIICFDGKDPGPAVVFAAFAAHIDLAAAVGGRIRDHLRSEIVDDRDPHSIAVASGKLFGFSIGGKELDASGF